MVCVSASARPFAFASTFAISAGRSAGFSCLRELGGKFAPGRASMALSTACARPGYDCARLSQKAWVC